MKKRVIFSALLVAGFTFTSCEKCSECHYDGPNGEIEIGEYCGDELEDIEASGFTVNDVNYEVHCHEH
ncbi:hypothetical protein [Brumimicrobium oceani]|uniref:Uncharacterized protein n=1 Tax=Brumimicrobium oceani TaxID=2100725 RepID=A0A2U2XD28_9FLAO|nr:hypothetical protein [Brumimicrobium oceani]PWH85692.1 hypothetical protein DIT68_08645 [Brumimicrobium oceani]